MADFTHTALCDIAARWLKKPLSAHGHGCQIAFTETRTGYLAGESPDAIGFRVSTRRYGGGSIVVECKVSRADFLHDSKKPHRAEGSGMGRFRYYLCPEGMIEQTEVPSGWGLVYATAKKSLRVMSGATLSIREPGAYDCRHDAFSETLLLANLLHRVGDADRLNTRLRTADRLNAHLQRRLETREKRLDEISKELWSLKFATQAQTENERAA
jgi:hypothetical protein